MLKLFRRVVLHLCEVGQSVRLVVCAIARGGDLLATCGCQPKAYMV